jgi:hypothetical protein
LFADETPNMALLNHFISSICAQWLKSQWLLLSAWAAIGFPQSPALLPSTCRQDWGNFPDRRICCCSSHNRDISLSPFSCRLSPAAAFCPLPPAISCS